MKKICFIFLTFIFVNSYSQQSDFHSARPPMGWNSWISYGVIPDEQSMLKNLRIMANRLKPYGYNYFVIDAGWHKRIRDNDTGKGILDQYGFISNYNAFPIGMTAFADSVHLHGLKFGLHIMRGISRSAWGNDFPIWGTQYTAKDIVDTSSVCSWSNENYGIDMTKVGAQAYYDSFIAQLVSWGVDFIKVDDMTGHPAEIEAVKIAIKKTGKNVVLSLSPGEQADPQYLNAYNGCQMVRVTSDIWDNQLSIDRAFVAWKKWSNVEGVNFWVDMDMIPFGHIGLFNPNPNYLSEKFEGEGAENGKERMCALSKDQQFTFITLRAMSASPLFMGGDLISTDEFSFSLLTNKEMLDCNKNGIIGMLVSDSEGIEIWKTPAKNKPDEGWIGIFNQTNEEVTKPLKIQEFRLGNSSISLYNIWQEIDWRSFLGTDTMQIKIKSNGVLFYKFKVSNL